MSSPQHPSSHVLADSPAGRILGQRLTVPVATQPVEVCAFRAIRYAEPPVGERRFAPPEPAVRSHEVRDATRSGPVAPQPPSRLRGAMGEIDAPQSEDCLHLTIWTPAADAGRRPVLVWFPGGAWQSGGAALDWYDGARLAARGDMVVVAVNYRLAAPGWLFVPGQVVNPGLLDQECGLRWIVDNIAAFGGDPRRITGMGQSAGATNVVAMLIRGAPFHRVILQSPVLGRAFRPAAIAADLGRRLLAVCGVDSVEEARRLPVSTLILAQGDPRIIEALREERAHRPLFCPVLDGDLLPEDIEPALVAAAGRVDVLVGHTLSELAAYGDGRADPASDAVSDRLFGVPARAWADAAIRQGRDAWSYRFDLAPNARFGACHSIDLPFVFGTLSAFADAPMLQGLDPRSAGALVDAVQQPWVDFVHGRTPGWPQAPAIRSLP